MIPNVVADNHSGSGTTRTKAVNANTQRSSGISVSSTPLSSLCVLASLLPFENKTSTLSLEILSSSMDNISALWPQTWAYQLVRLTVHQPLGDYSCPKESQTDFKTNTSSKVLCHQNRASNCNHVALSEKAQQFLLLFIRVSNTGTGNNMEGRSLPPVASTKQTQQNKADFWYKKPQSLTRPRQVVRHKSQLPLMSRSVSRSLSLWLEALQFWYALTNPKPKNLVDAQLMQHTNDTRHKEIGKRLSPELGLDMWKH